MSPGAVYALPKPSICVENRPGHAVAKCVLNDFSSLLPKSLFVEEKGETWLALKAQLPLRSLVKRQERAAAVSKTYGGSRD